MVAGARDTRVRFHSSSSFHLIRSANHVLFISATIRVDAQWIVAKKDYQQAKKQQKTNEKYSAEINEKNRTDDTQDAEPIYRPEMDEMRCILYFHGGGYYFGSVDQERYFLQRYARKFGGRILGMSALLKY